jgi:excisionase family DNA binding protein
MTGDIASLIEQHRGGMTVKCLSEITGIASPTLYAMARDNRIPAVKVSTRVIFDPAKVAAWWRSKEAA